jgi:hypothetical protein
MESGISQNATFHSLPAALLVDATKGKMTTYNLTVETKKEMRSFNANQKA